MSFFHTEGLLHSEYKCWTLVSLAESSCITWISPFGAINVWRHILTEGIPCNLLQFRPTAKEMRNLKFGNWKFNTIGETPGADSICSFRFYQQVKPAFSWKWTICIAISASIESMFHSKRPACILHAIKPNSYSKIHPSLSQTQTIYIHQIHWNRDS